MLCVRLLLSFLNRLVRNIQFVRLRVNIKRVPRQTTMYPHKHEHEQFKCWLKPLLSENESMDSRQLQMRSPTNNNCNMFVCTWIYATCRMRCHYVNYVCLTTVVMKAAPILYSTLLYYPILYYLILCYTILHHTICLAFTR